MEGKIVFQGKSKGGILFKIRYPKLSDVEKVWHYMNKLSEEKTFIRYQGEKVSFEEEKEYIQSKLKEINNNKSVVLFLIVNEKVMGICGIDLLDKTENHVAKLGLSIDQELRGQGLGEKLIISTMEESKNNLNKLQIIKLEVKKPNNIAIKLYKKLGFKKYGHLPKGTTHQGEYVDEIMMFKRVT